MVFPRWPKSQISTLMSSTHSTTGNSTILIFPTWIAFLFSLFSYPHYPSLALLVFLDLMIWLQCYLLWNGSFTPSLNNIGCPFFKAFKKARISLYFCTSAVIIIHSSKQYSNLFLYSLFLSERLSWAKCSIYPCRANKRQELIKSKIYLDLFS